MTTYNTHDYEGMLAETVTIKSRNDDFVNAYPVSYTHLTLPTTPYV